MAANPAGGVLFVCTGNQCRSPMAALMLRSALHQADIPVASAGFVSEGIPAPAGAVQAMNAIGLDLSGHRSRKISGTAVQSAGLIVVMERQHLVDLSCSFPEDWPRAFTFAELLRRVERVGGRRHDEAISDWSSRLNAGRSRSEILGLSLGDDVFDPIGGTSRAYVRARDELGAMVGRLAVFLVPA
jgi:low molecular weight protein-tyrosine phosphatase